MDLFSKIAKNYDHIISDFDLDSIIQEFPIAENELLLDLGGGTGRVATHFLNYVNECLVLDRSFEMLKQAQKKSSELILVQGTSDAMPFRANTIKQIFVNDTLHHVHRQRETLEDSYTILRSGGNLIIRDYDRKYFWNILLILFEKILRFGSKFFTPYELEQVCEEIGFNVSWKRLTKGTYLLTAVK